MPSNPHSTSVRCLILACGNTLRGDDGIGPWLAEWAEQRFGALGGVRILSRHQWTPELAEEIASAHSVIFIDCSVALAPGSVEMREVTPAENAELETHHLDAADLLALSLELYGTLPQNAVLLTIGADSTEIGEQFSDAVQGAIPGACGVLQSTVLCLLTGLGVSALPYRT